MLFIKYYLLNMEQYNKNKEKAYELYKEFLDYDTLKKYVKDYKHYNPNYLNNSGVMSNLDYIIVSTLNIDLLKSYIDITNNTNILEKFIHTVFKLTKNYEYSQYGNEYFKLDNILMNVLKEEFITKCDDLIKNFMLKKINEHNKNKIQIGLSRTSTKKINEYRTYCNIDEQSDTENDELYVNNYRSPITRKEYVPDTYNLW